MVIPEETTAAPGTEPAPVEMAPASPQEAAKPPVPAAEVEILPVLSAVPFKDVYGASSQAFADSRANLVARKDAVAAAKTTYRAVEDDETAMRKRHTDEAAAMMVRKDAAFQSISDEQAAYTEAQEDDKEAARALYTVLGGYING